MNPTWETVRVFISSTFRDMQAERDQLVRFVFPRLREKLLQYRLHLVDVDLRWGVTSEQDALEVCREIIDECRPRFLCMLGGRYGWVPPDKNRSITADEVYYGVLDRKGEDRRFTYFYFRDDTATAAMVEYIPGEFREPEGSDNQKKLAELKQAIVVAGLNPFIYPAQWDNESRRLAGLKQFSDSVYDDLFASIRSDPKLRDRFTTDTAMQLDEFAEENAAMEVFVEEHSNRFVLGSRVVVLEELIAHANATGGNGYVCLTGAPGSGKSALLAHLYKVLTSGPHPSIVTRHFVGASPGSTDVRRTLRRLCHEIKVVCPTIFAEIPEELEKLRVVFADFLRQACVRNRVVILLDAINQFDPVSHFGGFPWLPEELPANARVILSALEGSALEDLRRRPRKPREIELKPLTESDSEAIIAQFYRRYQKSFESDQRAELLAKTDAGIPLYLLVALEELRTLGSYEEIGARIAKLPPTTHKLFAWILERLENDDGFRDASGQQVGRALVSRFAALLSASRFGLSQRELVDLLDPGDSQGNVAAMQHLLHPYLMRRGELIDFYHGQFRAAAAEAYLPTDAQRQSAHTQLAHYFQARWSEPSPHAVREIPYHLAMGGLDPELGQLISDVNYLEEYVSHNGIGDLLQNLDGTRTILNQDSSVILQLTQELEILQNESGSLADWSRGKPVPDFYNQLANGATRCGYRGLFRRTISNCSQGFPGSVLLQWSLGRHEGDVKERLVMPGDRDSYSWDVYDYGPLGSRTNLWIDLPRSRLLTDTVSTYGSMDAGSYQSTHYPMEWDLESGVLLVKHDAEVDDWDEIKEIPDVFAGLVGLTTMRQGETVPLSLISGLNLVDGEEPIAVKAIGSAVNSEETVFSVTVRKPVWTFGPRIDSMLWVYDQSTGHAYFTSHVATEMTVQAIVRIKSGLMAVATDSDGHVYRLSLASQETTVDESPVLDAAFPEMPGEFACIRSTGLEIRTLRNNRLLQAYRRDELKPGRDGLGIAIEVSKTGNAEYDLRWTPDKQWLVINTENLISNVKIFSCEGGVAFRGGVLSTHTGELIRREWAEVPAPDRFRNNFFNNEQGELITRLGKYRLVKRRCSIDVWEVDSGGWIGSLGPGPQYGGGGNLYGIATHPNERFVISSDLEGIVVWDLEKNLESWRLGSISSLGKIRSLAFLWGGYLVAALTEEHILYMLRFWWQSEIVGAIRVDQGSQRIIGMPYGDSLLILYDEGRLGCYRFVPRPGDDVTTIDGNTIDVRFHSAGAREVHLAGTFNDWNPSRTSLETEDGEHWHVKITLPDGRHEYKIVVDGYHWELDPNVPFIPRAYGPNNYVDLPSLGQKSGM